VAEGIRIGLVGYKFMGKAHSNAYHRVAQFFSLPKPPVMKAICGRSEVAVEAMAERWGWESVETDYRRLVARDDIDLIDISTPNNTHAEIAIAAAKAGKHVVSEKPLAMNAAEAKKMLEAVQKAGVRHMVWFNYRRVPAIALAKKLIDEGALGRIFHVRAVYLQDWIVDPKFPLVWRLRREVAGSGAHGDLNAHIIDLARYLVGEFASVVGMSETFIKERPLEAEASGLGARAAARKGKVTVDDAVLFLARFRNGAIGSFEATRFAIGRKNGERIEINGEKGSLAFDFERMNELEFYSEEDPPDRRGFKTILVTEPVHPYISAWWPPGHIIGYEHTFVNQAADLLTGIAQDKPLSPDFGDGLRCQQVLDAVLDSAKSGTWVKVPK
jgi:predicted dehydrogenase